MENFEIKKLQKLNNWSIKIKMENLCIFRTESKIMTNIHITLVHTD
jgi:hypothetical protein